MIHNSTRYNDLAKLYNCTNGIKRINKVIDRNIYKLKQYKYSKIDLYYYIVLYIIWCILTS